MTKAKKYAAALIAALCALAVALTGCSSLNTIGVSYKLNMPDTYSIKYRVTDAYEGLSTSYTQTMTKAANGYYLELGSGNTSASQRYIFERQSNGNYLQYTSASLGGYTHAVITEVNETVITGLASPITANFTYYSAYAPYMVAADAEAVAGVACDHYTASIREFWGDNDAEFWIDPDTGLCLKLKYSYRSPVGTVGTRTIECTNWQTANVTLPSHG